VHKGYYGFTGVKNLRHFEFPHESVTPHRRLYDKHFERYLIILFFSCDDDDDDNNND
jgi:hypothetical protein